MFWKRHEWGLLAAILVCVLTTAVLDANHSYWSNPQDNVVEIIRQTSLLGIFALGAAIVIIAGGIDLSSGSVIAASATTYGTISWLLNRQAMEAGDFVGVGVMITAIVAALIVGALIGSLHAWLITVIGLPPFVATLATLVGLRSLCRAIVERVTEGRSQIEVPDLKFLSANIWIPAGLFLILAAATWFLLSRTVTGRHLYALGGNEQAARLSGIRTDQMKWLAYTLSAVLSSIAGILYVGDQGGAYPQTMGRGYELNGIASAVVGGCSLQGGVGTIPGTVLGALFLRIVVDGVAKVIKTQPDIYEGLIVGIVVVVAVAITQFRSGRGRVRQFFPGWLGLINVFNLALLAGSMSVLVLPQMFSGKSSLSPVLLGMSTGLGALVILSLVKIWEGKRGKG